MNYTRNSLNKKAFLLQVAQLGKISFFKELQKTYDQSFRDFLSMVPECPHCQQTTLSFYDHCPREVYFTTTLSFTLQISRIYCHACGRCSRILPEYLVPHKRYVIGIICLTLDKKRSIYALAKIHQLSSRLIRYWRHQYHKWHELGLQALLVQLPLTDCSSFLVQYEANYHLPFMTIVPAARKRGSSFFLLTDFSLSMF